MMKSEKLKSTRNGVEAFSRLACSNERQSRALLFCVLAEVGEEIKSGHSKKRTVNEDSASRMHW